MKSQIAATALMLALAGCAAVPQGAGTVGPPTLTAPRYSGVGLERVLGAGAGGLVQLFGNPQLDVREGTARKLQFGGGTCVLDAYLYPRGGAEPTVTHVDARRPDGQSVDRAACVAALARR